jgi:hypothetical protein
MMLPVEAKICCSGLYPDRRDADGRVGQREIRRDSRRGLGNCVSPTNRLLKVPVPVSSMPPIVISFSPSNSAANDTLK